MEILMGLLTVVVGFIGAGVLGTWLNWPDAGAVVAIAFMGSIILWRLKDFDREEKDEREEDKED